jgi:hypothetical protein
MSSILFLDAAQHPHDNLKDSRCPALETSLEQLGFRVLGQVLVIPQDINPVRVYASPQDQAEHEAILKGTVGTALVAGDGTAFAEPERAHDMNYLRFRSLLETGDIVETRLRPQRELPRLPFADPQDCQTDEQREVLVRTDELLEQLIGRNDEGRHPYLAAAGLHRQTLADKSAAELWERHRERVREVAGRLGTSPVEHRALGQFLAMTRRGWHVQNRYTDRRIAGIFWFQFAMTAVLVGVGLVIAWASGSSVRLLCFLLASAIILCAVAERWSNEHWELTWGVGTLATLALGHFLELQFWPLFTGMIYLLFVFALRHVWALIFMYRVAPPICRRIPLPRRVPARDLEKVCQ